MPLPTDRLDVIVVPADPSAPVDAAVVLALFDRWQAADMLAAGTGPLRRTAGARAWALLPGGFGVAWLDRPGAPTLYANQLGGFRVPCPGCGAPLALAFGKAVQAARAGLDDTVTCDRCGHRAPVNKVPTYPPSALARGAVVFGDAHGIAPAGPALRDLAEALGGLRVVLRRR